MFNENGSARPDGYSAAAPLWGPFGISGTYYRNPGSTTAPSLTVTGSLGVNPGFGLHSVFLRKGMTSEDTLGYGATANISAGLPSLTVNASIPDENGIPLPWKAKVSSIEAGIGSPGSSGAITYTSTPQEIADFLVTHGVIGAARIGSVLPREVLTRSYPSVHVISPAMGPDDELSPFARTLRSGIATIGETSESPVRFLNSRYPAPLGAGMADWGSTIEAANLPPPAQPVPTAKEPGGLLGIVLDYQRNQDRGW